MKTFVRHFFLLILFAPTLHAQFANNWFFGNNAGLNFNSNPPTGLSSGITSGPDNSSTISDANGNLLFYTEGLNVRNSQHNIMPNGNGLIGHGSGGQCALIIPIPCDNSKYVIFHTTEFSNPGYLHYSVVDMSLNGGLGDVVAAQKNVSLGSGWTEKLCAIYNPQGHYYWLLTHKWGSNNFVAIKIDATSIASQSVTTSIGSVHNCGTYGGAHDAMGQLTISRDGSTVVNALTCQDKFELFQFNLNTGVLSNMISLNGEGYKAWGTAFSPDSKKLYTSSIFGTDVFQYDLTNYNFNSISSSKQSIIQVQNSAYNFGYMELGPNNRLYIAKPNQSNLATVQFPNLSGMASNPALVGLILTSGSSNWGTSRIAYNIPQTGQSSGNVTVTSASGSFSICSGQSITLIASGANSYTWSNSATSSSITLAPISNMVLSVQAPGGQCAANSVAQVTVNVHPTPTINTIGTNTLCTRSNITITATGANSYQWSGGQQGPQIVVLPLVTTVYTVTGTNTVTGCSASAIHLVSVASTPTLTVFGSTVACIGSQVTYSALGATVLNWSSGGSGPVTSFVPAAPGLYTLTGINGGMCQASTTFSINLVECLFFSELNFREANLIYPNPVKEEITIDLQNFPQLTQVDRLELLNVLGEVLKVMNDTPLKNGKIQINLTEFSTGTYYLRIVADRLEWKKIILKS